MYACQKFREVIHSRQSYCSKNKKAVLSQEDRAMLLLFFRFKVRRQHLLQA